MHAKFEGWPHILRSQQFYREWLDYFFEETGRMEASFRNGSCKNILSGKIIIELFFEPSTRTSTYFYIATKNLGGEVIEIKDPEHLSSQVKGEPYHHMIRVFSRGLQCGMSHKDEFHGAIVVRHQKEGMVALAAEASSVPVINAGDGIGQHPTQALLDVYTIKKLLGKIDGLSIAMVGDLMNGRTVHSLSYLLGKFKDVKIFFVSPKCAQMKDDIKDYLKKHGVAFIESNNLLEIASQIDILYETRIQRERGTDFDQSDRSFGFFDVNEEVINIMPRHARIMHPLPKVNGVYPELDNSPMAVYFTDQLDASILTKMTLLKLLFYPDFT